MPFHPIALHFHIAIFMVNIVAIAILAVMRIFVAPSLLDEEKTRGQRVFQSLDWVVVITLIVGIIVTVIGILTGFGELISPPEVVETITYDMFMWLKIYMSFVFLALYTLPLLYRIKYGTIMWKSRVMSLCYVLFMAAGFYLVLITTFLGSYDTSAIIYGTPVELSKQVLELLSPTFIFVIFGAAPGNIVTNYSVGDYIPFSWTTFLTTTVMIVAICLGSLLIFYVLRKRQIKSANERFNQLIGQIQKGKIDRSNLEFKYLLQEMMALKITVKLDQIA